VGQGYTYLNTILEQKEDFVITFSEAFPNDIKAIEEEEF